MSGDNGGIFPPSELLPAKSEDSDTDAAAPTSRAVRASRPRRRSKPSVRPFDVQGDRPLNNFARDWLAFNFAVDQMLGIEPGDMRRQHNRGFKPGPTRRFLEGLRIAGQPEESA